MALIGAENCTLYFVLWERVHVAEKLKRPQVIETSAYNLIGYALITAKTQVKIHFVQYLNFK